MAQTTYKIRRLDDHALYELFQRAKEEVDRVAEDESLDGPELSGEVTLEGPAIIGELDFETYEPATGKYLIESVSLRLRAPTSAAPNNSKTFSIQRGFGGSFDELKIPDRVEGSGAAAWESGRPRAGILAVHDVLSSAMAAASEDDGTALGRFTNYAQSIDASFRSFTKGLEATLQTLSDQRAEEQKRNDEERKRLRTANEEERQRLLDAAREEARAKTALLDERERELEEREAQLEIKSHKDARRQLFKELQQELQDSRRSPGATLPVMMTRWAVFLTLIAGGGVAAWFALSSMTPDDLPGGATSFQIWTVILKPIGLSLLALGSFAAAVQWLRHFYTQDLRAAAETQRFGHDMARASWIMEAYLEMTKEHGVEEVPESWIRNATEGLFQADRGRHQIDDATNALAALLGMSGSVKAGPNGLEFNVGRRALRRISEAPRSDDDQ